MGFKAYIVKRTLQVVPVIFLILVLNFLLIHLAPGDPAVILAGDEATPEVIEAIRRRYGLDQPFHVQMFVFFTMLLSGDLGTSLTYHSPVLPIILDKLYNTATLILTSGFIAIMLGTVWGAYSARKFPSKTDNLFSFVSLGMFSTPVFWAGLIVMFIFGVHLRIFPVSGMMSPFPSTDIFDTILDRLAHLVLPVLTLNIYYIPYYYRITRASVIEVMKEDFITTARIIGYKEITIFFKHALRNALLPTTTMAGLWLGTALTGTVLTETVFSWPGMGSLMLTGISTRDYPLLMGIFVVASIMITLAQLVTDIAYTILDPRVVYE